MIVIDVGEQKVGHEGTHSPEEIIVRISAVAHSKMLLQVQRKVLHRFGLDANKMFFRLFGICSGSRSPLIQASVNIGFPFPWQAGHHVGHTSQLLANFVLYSSSSQGSILIFNPAVRSFVILLV